MNSMKIRKILFTTLAAGTFMATAGQTAFAQATVTGKEGCIIANGGKADASSPMRCDENYPNGGTLPGSGGGGSTPVGLGIYDSFVTADEVNNALAQVYSDLGGTGYTYDPSKDNEQDTRLDASDTKNSQQDSRLDAGDAKDREQDGRLGDHDKAIGDINDGAVFYNRDSSGNKTGGVTFNDGTGNPVGLGNVAAGKQGTDAVNVDQLASALDGLGGGTTINVDGSITGPTYNIGGVDYHNVGDALRAQGLLAVQYVADENGNPTNTVLLTGDGTGAPVKMTNVAAGTEDTDAVNYSQIKNNVGYDTNPDGSRGDSITLVGGSNSNVTIHNLADGKLSSDAATVGQVNRARQDSFDYTDQQIGMVNNRLDSLNGRVSEVQKEMRGGVASAMASAALRYDDRPGKLSLTGAVGGFKSATSMAAGLGYTSEDGRWRMNGSVAHSFSTSDTAWNAGASWTFN